MSKHNDPYGPTNQDSLSAFFDNEATHADIDLLLNSDMKTLADKADVYHRIHQSVQSDNDHMMFRTSDFLAGFHEKLDQVQVESNVVAFPGKKAAPMRVEKLDQVHLPDIGHVEEKLTKRSLFSGLAVAASVAMVVVLGGNALLQGNDPVTPNFVASQPALQVEPAAPISALSAEEALENNTRLQQYLRQHAQQASMSVGQGMIPMAKVVGYPQGNGQ